MLFLQLQNSQSLNDLPERSEEESKIIKLVNNNLQKAKCMTISYQAPKRDRIIYMIYVDKSSIRSFIYPSSKRRPENS